MTSAEQEVLQLAAKTWPFTSQEYAGLKGLQGDQATMFKVTHILKHQARVVRRILQGSPDKRTRCKLLHNSIRLCQVLGIEPTFEAEPGSTLGTDFCNEVLAGMDLLEQADHTGELDTAELWLFATHLLKRAWSYARVGQVSIEDLYQYLKAQPG